MTRTLKALKPGHPNNPEATRHVEETFLLWAAWYNYDTPETY